MLAGPSMPYMLYMLGSSVGNIAIAASQADAGGYPKMLSQDGCVSRFSRVFVGMSSRAIDDGLRP